MSSSNKNPRWRRLYLAVLLLMMLFMVDSRLKIPTRWHQVVQIGIVLIVYGLVRIWIKANTKALSEVDWARCCGSVRVIKIPPDQLTDREDAYKSPSMLQLSEEIKGTLSKAFEIETIDAEFVLPIDEVRKN